MKLMMISSEYYPVCCGGVEVITQVISEGLVKMGHEVVVVCGSNTNTLYYHNGVKIIKINALIPNKRNIKITRYANRILQIYNPFNINKYCSLIREEKPDIIHIHMVRLLSFSFLRATQICNIPTISTLHEYFSLWNFNPFDKMENMLISHPPFYVEWLRKVHRKLTQNVNWVTSPMEYTFYKYSEEGYYKNCPYTYIHNALAPVNHEIIERIKQERLTRTPRKILMIGRLMPFKGVEKTISYFCSCPFFSEWELHIAGEGPLSDMVKEACSKDSRVFYHGYVIDKEKEELFCNCDVLLFLTDELETFGLVVLEAFQHCMPVISSDVKAMKKLIIHKKNGLMVDRNNVDQLKDAMDFLSNKDNYYSLVKYICESDWNKPYQNMLKDYQTIYSTVLLKSKSC